MLNFTAKNLGKVKEGRISTSPLVMLIGRNNTGKSYIATLIWALSHLSPLLSSAEARKRRPKWFKDFVSRKRLAEGPRKFELREKHLNALIEYVNRELAQSGSSFFADIFAFDGFSNATTTILPPTEVALLDIVLQEVELTENNPLAAGATSVTIQTLDGSIYRRTRTFSTTNARYNSLIDSVFIDIVGFACFGNDWRAARTSVYIPAARTGLMLAHRALASQNFSIEDALPVELPKPVAAFLERLTNPFAPKRSEGVTAPEWLRDRVLQGVIDVKEEGVLPTFSYRPSNTDLAVPMHAASSMITELAPFLVLMRRPIGQVIFEEPEAHLHLSAQRQMARTIGRLINSGVQVVLTTHSDTFVQQINNLMRLFDHPRKADIMSKFDYKAEDIIDPKQVRAYEFRQEEDGTAVVELERRTEGFVVPSLNETLKSLAEETIMLYAEK